MTKARFLLSATLAAVSLAGSAQAAPVVVAFNLTALFEAGSPVETITGQFSVAFDDAADISSTSAGLTVTDLNFVPSAPLTYAFNARTRGLVFGSNQVQPNSFSTNLNANDFGAFYNVRTGVSFAAYTFSTGQLYRSTSAVATPVTPSVPEPATWAMMIGGFGLIGFAMRRRQQVRLSYAD